LDFLGVFLLFAIVPSPLLLDLGPGSAISFRAASTCSLEEVGKLTGREMVLNTSFNVKGQPIVNTPREALETFLGTGVEYLFLENTLIRKIPKHDLGKIT
jgi:hypothetical protein